MSKSTASDPFAAAVRLLSRRDRSSAELTEKLQQFGFPAADIEAALDRCRDYGYLDDARYARERARSLLRSGRGVGPKVLFDLRQRGIDETTAEQALEAAAGELSSAQILREQLERRFPEFRYESADERQRRRVIGFFQRRGFALAEIFQVLKQESTDPT